MGESIAEQHPCPHCGEAVKFVMVPTMASLKAERDQATARADEMEADRPAAHKHMTLPESYAMLVKIFGWVGNAHTAMSRKFGPNVTGLQLDERVEALVGLAEQAEADLAAATARADELRAQQAAFVCAAEELEMDPGIAGIPFYTRGDDGDIAVEHRAAKGIFRAVEKHAKMLLPLGADAIQAWQDAGFKKIRLEQAEADNAALRGLLVEARSFVWCEKDDPKEWHAEANGLRGRIDTALSQREAAPPAQADIIADDSTAGYEPLTPDEMEALRRKVDSPEAKALRRKFDAPAQAEPVLAWGVARSRDATACDGCGDRRCETIACEHHLMHPKPDCTGEDHSAAAEHECDVEPDGFCGTCFKPTPVRGPDA